MFELNIKTKINSDKNTVWDTIVNPEKVSLYMFGTKITTDYKVGNPITFEGEYQEKKYKDIGEIIEYQKNSILQYSYLSSFSGLKNIPENYQMITFKLNVPELNEELKEGSDKESMVELEIIQSNMPSEEVKQHSKDNWKYVIGKIKEMAESN